MQHCTENKNAAELLIQKEEESRHSDELWRFLTILASLIPDKTFIHTTAALRLTHNGFLTVGNVFTKMNSNINTAQVLFYFKSWTFDNFFVLNILFIM